MLIRQDNLLLVVERMLLESLIQGPKTYWQIADDTKLEKVLLVNSISGLIMNNFVKYRSGVYSINVEIYKQFEIEESTTENKMDELKELITALVDNYYDGCKEGEGLFSFKKLWFSEEEEKEFQTQMLKLDTFIKKSQKNNEGEQTSDKKTCDKKLFFIGYANYSTLINNIN